MLMGLFKKELKITLKSITFIVFLLCVFAFFYTQFSDFDVISKPLPNQELSYGTKQNQDKEIIKEQLLIRLKLEIANNEFITYPHGFYKNVQLDEGNLNEVNALYNRLSSTNFSTDDFFTYLTQVDAILGGGSYYAASSAIASSQVEMTYEEALEAYNSIINDDKITHAYARLFCDYLGIILAVMPVFVIVARALADKTSYAIYSKAVPSYAIVLSRAFAAVSLMLLSTFIMAIFPLAEIAYFANANSIAIDLLAFPLHILGWLFPTILFVTAISFFITELTSTPIAIALILINWFTSLNMTSGKLVGYVGLNLIPRFNTLGEKAVFDSIFSELLINRITYTALGILFLALTIFVYDKKRKGWSLYGKNLSKA